MSQASRRQGFTLVELLVVIAIIGILIGMLLPAVQQVREAARRIQCGNQMRQLSLAMHNFESSNQHFPSGVQTRPGAFDSARRQPGLNWHVLVLPFIEQDPLFTVVNDVSDRLSNPRAVYESDVVLEVIPNFICPSCPMGDLNDVRPAFGDEIFAGKSNYVGIWGTEVDGNSDYNVLADDEDVWDPSTYSGILFINSETGFGEIQDGTSNTFIIAERDGAPLDGLDSQGRPAIRAAATWCATQQAQWSNQCLGPVSRELNYTINTIEVNDPSKWNAISSQHPGGANFGRADGSVQFVNDTIGGDAYEALGTKAGGETNTEF